MVVLLGSWWCGRNRVATRLRDDLADAARRLYADTLELLAFCGTLAALIILWDRLT